MGHCEGSFASKSAMVADTRADLEANWNIDRGLFFPLHVHGRELQFAAKSHVGMFSIHLLGCSSRSFFLDVERRKLSSLASPKVKALKHPGHIVSYLGGHRMLLSSGQACSCPMKGTHAKYGAFAYGSAYGYSIPTGCFSLEQFALASQLGLSDDGGEVWKTRRLCEEAAIETQEVQSVLKSIWKPFPGVRIKTYLLAPIEVFPNWHLRVHKIEAGREVLTADGAFAICNESKKGGRYLDLYNAETGEGTLPKIIGNYDLNTLGGSSPGLVGAFAVSKGAVGIADL